jgi:hypothetical protein
MIEHDVTSKEALSKEMEVVNANLQILEKIFDISCLCWKINNRVQCKMKMFSNIQN